MTAAKKLAREYELIYILRPAIGAVKAKKVSDRVTDVFEKMGARLTHVDQWGKRKLAYPIKKHTRGQFIYLRFVGFADVVAELERNLRILDEVIRYQTVRLEGLFDLDAVEVDPAEIEFAELEQTEEEEVEPSFEEQLGMKRRQPERRPEPEATEGEAAPAAEGEAAPAAEGEAAPAAEGEAAPAAEGEAAPAAEGEAAPAAEGEAAPAAEGKAAAEAPAAAEETAAEATEAATPDTKEEG